MTAPAQLDSPLSRRVAARLRSRAAGSPVFRGALAGVYVDSFRNGYLQISARNDYEREFLRTHYLPMLLKCVSIETSALIERVDIRVRRTGEVLPCETDATPGVVIDQAFPWLTRAPEVADSLETARLDEVLELLAYARSIDDLDRAVEKLLLAHGRAPKNCSQKPAVKIDDVQRVVARRYDISRVDLLSARRTWNVVKPRQIAMYLARSLTGKSLPEIGRRFGDRDHTTVGHALNRVKAAIASDAAFAAVVQSFTEELTGASSCD